MRYTLGAGRFIIPRSLLDWMIAMVSLSLSRTLYLIAAIGLCGCSDSGGDRTPTTPTPAGSPSAGSPSPTLVPTPTPGQSDLFEVEAGTYALILQSPEFGMLSIFRRDLILSPEGRAIHRNYITFTDLGDGRLQVSSCNEVREVMTAQQVREYLLEADALSAYEEIDQHCGASAITSEAKDHLQVRQDCGIYGSRTQTISKVAESEAEHASSVSLEWSSVGSVSYSGPVCSSTTYQHYRVASAEGSGDGSNGVQMAAVTVPLSGAGDGSSLMVAIQPGFEDSSYSAANKWDLFGQHFGQL